MLEALRKAYMGTLFGAGDVFAATDGLLTCKTRPYLQSRAFVILANPGRVASSNVPPASAVHS